MHMCVCVHVRACVSVHKYVHMLDCLCVCVHVFAK